MAERTKYIHAQRSFRFLPDRHKTLANGTLAKRLVGETTNNIATVLFRTTLTWEIMLHLLMKWLLGSKLSQFCSIMAPISLIDYVMKRNSFCVVSFLENVFRRLLKVSAALWREWKILNICLQTTKIWLRPGTFHEPNQIHWLKYMKSSASESIRNAYFNLERLNRSSRLPRQGI